MVYSSVTIRGERVQLRAVEPADIEATIAHLRGHPEEARLGGPGFLDFPESDAALRESLTSTHPRAGRHDRGWSIVRLEDGVIVGDMATYLCDPRVGAFHHGIVVFPEHRRRGYASDAIRALVRHHFEEQRYQKANVGVYEFNQASIALYERLGFQLEGRIRRMVYTQGRHYDLLHFGLVSDDLAGWDGT